MSETLFIFCCGFAGVFLGMTLLYASIKIMSFLLDSFGPKEVETK